MRESGTGNGGGGGEIARVLLAHERGEEGAFDELVSLVYDDLR